jgi:hypothetical protein
MTTTTVASANVRSSLGRAAARDALESVLAHAPDLVGLQEWYVVRRGLLRESSGDYRWYAPLAGGCAVGVRRDRPRLVRRHRAEVCRVVGLVTQRLERGETVYAVGDSNFHGLSIPGLASAWSPGDRRGTLGPRRQVDDVFGPGAAASVALVPSRSDHRAVVAVRRAPG